MQKILMFLMAASCVESWTLSQWRLPDPNKPISQYTFAVAHNAYSNKAEGWRKKPQQNWSIEQQLMQGVRGFQLDVWDFKGELLLCHGGCDPVKLLEKRGNVDKPRTLASVLEQLTRWLVANPKEIIFVFLENRVNNDKLKNAILGVPGLKDVLLTPQGWNPATHNNDWPTLSWMQSNNKRMIIFNEDKSNSRGSNINDPFYYSYAYIIENQYNTFDKKKLCKQRSESAVYNPFKRSLVFFNYFEFSKTDAKDNSYENLKKVITNCNIDGVPKGKKPNFITVDFIDQGDVMKLVNEFNAA